MMAKKKPEIKYTKLFINNEFVDAESGKTFATIDPSDETEIAQIAEGDKADIDKAVRAAREAFKLGSAWRTMDASERGRLILKLTSLMSRDLDYIAALDTLDNGKTFTSAKVDVEQAISTLEYYAGMADKIHGDTIPADGSVMCYTRLEPVGVVGQIIPWNYPVAMLAWKWAPALAAGCTIVLKPAELTPLSSLYMGHLTREAGFPAGVVNVVPGYGHSAGAAVASHHNIDKVAFTGSTQVGKMVMAAAATSNLKRVSLELGGKSPLVIMDDVDIEKAAEIAHEAIFANHGQNCCAGSRTFVHEDIYDKFVSVAAEKARNRKVGDPWQDESVQGPQVSKVQFDKILGFIKSGEDEGARLEAGGKRSGEIGYFVEPTVFSGVEDNMKIASEEIFGPVQSILKFSTIDEVLERCNNTNYGLAAGILTNNINTALMFSQGVEAGSVWINCYDHTIAHTPFGGFKQSGQGRELGPEGIKAYLEVKTVTIALDQKNS